MLSIELNHPLGDRKLLKKLPVLVRQKHVRNKLLQLDGSLSSSSYCERNILWGSY